MSILRIEITQPDGKIESMLVDADRVLVGSGAHCEVRLPLDQAAVEHVALETQAGFVRAQARAFEPQATINGVPFTEAALPADAVLAVGAVRMRVAPAEAQKGDRVVTKKQGKTSPMTYVLAAIAIPLGAYVILDDDGADARTTAPPQAPALWAAPETQCPQPAPAKAQALARDKLTIAEGKRERRPFHVQDGVAAVPIFEVAAACFRVAGDAESAKETEDGARELRAQVNEDYRTHRVRLEHALSVSDWRTAQHEIRVLLAFTEGKGGDYVTWLSNLDRQLRLQHGRE